MKQKNFLITILVLAIALSGCVEPEPETILKYICCDGSMADKPADCPALALEDCQQLCKVNKESICEEALETGKITVEKILSEIDKANYCETEADCVETDTKCPIGCYNLVNSSELDSINALVKDFKQTCFQTCTTLNEMVCEEGKCKPVDVGFS
jgi:hypothetical protein